MDTLRQDLRFALRAFAKSPGFAAAAIVSLALGIGANTAIFSAVNAVLLGRSPLESPERFVRLYTSDTRNPGWNWTSLPNFRDYREQAVDVFSDLVAYNWVPVNLTTGAQPTQIFGQIATANYFTALGIAPVLGRGFLPEEEDRAEPVVVLSHGLWKTRFQSDPDVVGRAIEMNGMVFSVVGVAPPELTGFDTGLRPELWVPLGMHARMVPDDDEVFDDRRTLSFSVIGRLRDGVTLERAAAAVDRIGKRLAAAYPTENAGRSGALLPLTSATLDPDTRAMARLASIALMTVAGFVLLIACANVANLLLGRASARRREIAVRLALGASRGRLLRQLVTESLLLASTAGVLGLLLGSWSYGAIVSHAPDIQVTLDLDHGMDGRILGFTLGVSLLAGLLFGLLPALQSTSADTAADLKDRAGDGGARSARLRGALVVCQVAFSLVALVGAGLFLRSLQNAQGIDPGFDAQRLAVASFDLGAQGYLSAQGEAFHRSLLERVLALPGVDSATLATHLALFGGGFGRTVFPEGAQDETTGTFVLTNVVGPRYFETVGVPVLRGRDLLPTDKAGAPRVAVVNEAMAKRFWPRNDAIGRRFRFFGTEAYEVVGIARDSKLMTLGEEPRACAYLSLAQDYTAAVTLHVRTRAPEAVLAPMRRELSQLDPRLPLVGVTTFRQRVDLSLWAPRIAADMLGAFGLLALTIATLGLYGVMAFSVARRTREIGLRVALGAAPRDVLGLVMKGGLRLALAGIVLGVLGGAVLARFVSSLLYDVSSLDAATFVLVPLTLLAAALLASYLPARRATRVDPIVALRYE